MSAWILKKKYFSARIADNFLSKLVEHIAEDEGCTKDEVMSNYDGKGELTLFCNAVSGKVVEVHQYPDSDDHFERNDDSFVIPSRLFAKVD